MPAPGRFNIRVYGIWIHEGKLLVNEELIRGRQVIKLPGGGMEYGEGTIDCLKREWMEELGMAIEVRSHFYTTDFLQWSAYDESQVISIYYKVNGGDPLAAITNHEDNERTFWLPLSDLTADTFTLPIDRRVGELLQAAFTSGGL